MRRGTLISADYQPASPLDFAQGERVSANGQHILVMISDILFLEFGIYLLFVILDLEFL